MEKEYNEIKVCHHIGSRFGEDAVTICIDNTSTGALRIFGMELKELKEKQKENMSDAIVSKAYMHLINKLEKVFNEEINKNN